MHSVQSDSVFPIKHIRSFDFIDGTSESPQEHPHKSRRTLMPLQECEIVRYSANQLEMTPDSPALALKLVFVQRRQHSCLVKTDTSGI